MKHDKENYHDSVHHPKHYQTYLKGFEAIKMIYSTLGPEGFEAYCRGSAMKYLIRADKKGGVEDLKKAAVYLQWEIEMREGAEGDD